MPSISRKSSIIIRSRSMGNRTRETRDNERRSRVGPKRQNPSGWRSANRQPPPTATQPPQPAPSRPTAVQSPNCSPTAIQPPIKRTTAANPPNRRRLEGHRGSKERASPHHRIDNRLVHRPTPRCRQISVVSEDPQDSLHNLSTFLKKKRIGRT